MMYFVLTVADHLQNGFIALAKTGTVNPEYASEILAKLEQIISPEERPNSKVDDYCFILDLMKEAHHHVDEVFISTQMASKIAPEQVKWWFDNKPNPNKIFLTHRPALIELKAIKELIQTTGGE